MDRRGTPRAYVVRVSTSARAWWNDGRADASRRLTVRLLLLFNRIHVNHLDSALLDERPGDRDLLAHLVLKQFPSRLVVLQASRDVQVALGVEYADRVAGLGAAGRALFLRRTAVSAFEVAPQIDDLAFDGHLLAFQLSARRKCGHHEEQDGYECSTSSYHLNPLEHVRLL